MALSQLVSLAAPTALLQRSLANGRLAHACLFLGDSLDAMELLACNLAKTLNCERHARGFPAGADACDACPSCRKIDHYNHADVQWLRPESKSRIISVEQIRELLHTVYLKPTEARYKVTILVAADRLNPQAANAFLKTLEEPPANTIFILLSTEPQRILETVRSRCQRLHCGGAARLETAIEDWLVQFCAAALAAGGGLFGRYRLLDELLQRLGGLKEEIETSLTAQSPMEHHLDADPKLIERWKDELAAGIEAEYRRRRSELLAGLQGWLRDVWLGTRHMLTPELATFPQLARTTHDIAGRLDETKAARNLEVIENTQRLLHTNVQEALALEIGLLKLSI